MLLVQRIFPGYRSHMSFLRASPLQSFVTSERCVNHLTSFAYLIKEPLDAFSAAIWPCSRWKKIPIRSFLCRQNHFPRLIRHQTNNCCYFLLDSFFVSGTSTLSPIVISTKNLFPPTFEYLPFMCFCWSRCDTTQNPSVNFESAKLLFLSGMQYLQICNQEIIKAIKAVKDRR